MKLLIKALLLVTTAVNAAILPQQASINYDGYKVLRITGDLGTAQKKLSAITFNEWAHDASRMDIAVSPDQFDAFKILGLNFEVLHENLGASIATESVVTEAREGQADNLTWFRSYHAYAEHEAYFTKLQASFPKNSELVSSGKSYQGRNIFGIHLWGAGGPGKPAILWHGTVHAREWISAMTVEYMTSKLITDYITDVLVKSFLDKYDFYVIPFVNPDGFVFSQTTDRLWRKNRMPPPSNWKGAACYGVDINRNWPYQWNTTNNEGASGSPCSEVYQGEFPSSSPENKGLVSLVNKLRDTNSIKLYIDWHSYGQDIASAWGYNCDIVPEDSSEHVTLAGRVASAIRSVDGKAFEFGPSCTIIYQTTGVSIDYIKGPGQADWVYTIELRDTGGNGFVLPPEQIIPSGKEQWEGMKVMLGSLG
ncbi:hypothetical protein EJ08DRAFT_578292 [Tothia fuscella]|uniref:Peptidase M14 domain-containing protein n=1 Tax=Tothia fuscella TaxID=1048955 RepID=A0A9P4P178_9PEZI|nr:hypothetical protein EJ08DRAFT_578292 [Tothia fuscella]